MKRKVSGFSRTIYDFGERSQGFLDPWSSLKPAYLRQKIAPEILGVFRYGSGGLKFDPYFKVKEGFVDPSQLKDKWALVFPKKTYLPPNYPHFQLWLLGEDYVPSPKFMSEAETRALGLILEKLLIVYRQYAQKNKLPGKIAFGYNSTPFSFIKDHLGRYYAGGQSVRAFHLHCLLIPPAQKITVSQSELSLVYPTSFCHLLLRMIFKNRAILGKLEIGKSKKVFKTSRGIKIADFEISSRGCEKLWRSLRKIDKLLYKVQSLLILAFYEDADQFLGQLEKVAASRRMSEVEKVLKKLIIVGRERDLEEVKHRLITALGKLAANYQTSFASDDLDFLARQLLFNEEGDLSSFVFGQKVVLRPGLGYACLLELEKAKKISLKIQPLDVLGSKGLIESSGYWFTKKIIKNEFPSWAIKISEDLISSFK